MTRPKGYMDAKLFYKILEEYRENNTFVKINGFGENLMHPCIDAFISEIKKHNSLYFTSNCQDLQISTTDILIKNEVDVLQISAQGTNKKSYESQRINASYDSLIEHIKDIIKRRDNAQYPFIHMSTTILDETPEQIEDFINFWFEIGVDSIGIGRTDYDRVIDSMITKPRLRKKIADFKSRQTLEKISDHSYLYRYCDICFDGIVVSSFFDFDQFVPVGDMKKDSLFSIWNNSEVLNALRVLEEKRLLNNMKVFDTFYHAWHRGNESYNLKNK
jgi:MoaA/NifB/PqqE/SkfB family radical SAM enzyme